MKVLRQCPLHRCWRTTWTTRSKRRPTCSAQLHLPTHDLFWAKVRVQLHLPPLRSLDLAWNPAGFFYTRGSLTSNCSGMIACTGGMSECSFECEYVPWVNGQWIEGTGSVQHRLKTAELFSVTMRRVRTHTHCSQLLWGARVHTHTHCSQLLWGARAHTYTHYDKNVREREQTGIKRVRLEVCFGRWLAWMDRKGTTNKHPNNAHSNIT